MAKCAFMAKYQRQFITVLIGEITEKQSIRNHTAATSTSYDKLTRNKTP